jgi:hypothetical protein
MLMKTIFLSLFSLLFSFSISLACSCTGPDTFCKGVTETADVVMVSKGEEVKPGIFEFSLIENLLNGISEEKLLLATGSGWDCLLSLNKFELGDTLIFRLEAAGSWVSAEEVDYAVTFCGKTYLQFNNGLVKGIIDDGINELSLDALRKKLNSCAFPTEEPIRMKTTILYPNPTDRSIILNASFEIQEVQLFDLSGRKCEAIVYELDAFNAEIDLNPLAKGMYILRITGIETKESFRVVKY